MLASNEVVGWRNKIAEVQTTRATTHILLRSSFSDHSRIAHASLSACIFASVVDIDDLATPMPFTRASKHSTQWACMMISKEREHLLIFEIFKQSELMARKSCKDNKIQ